MLSNLRKATQLHHVSCPISFAPSFKGLQSKIVTPCVPGSLKLKRTWP